MDRTAGSPRFANEDADMPRLQHLRAHLPRAVLALGLAAGLFAVQVSIASTVRAETIFVLVNDDMITEYDVDQRTKLMGLSGGGGGGDAEVIQRLKAKLKDKNIGEQFKAFAIKRNPQSKADVEKLKKLFVDTLKAQIEASLGKKKASSGTRDKALLELISDRLKVQEARKLDVLVDDEELNGYVKQLAEDNGQSEKSFAGILESRGIKVTTMREKLRAQISWKRVLARRFRDAVSVGQSDIDSAIASKPGDAAIAGAVELQLQRVTLAQPGKLDQNVMAERYLAADNLHKKITGCKDMAAAAKGVPGARFENLGKVSLDELSNEARPILAQANAGDVPPPVFSGSGIEVYAVCDKTAGAKSEGARNVARQKIEGEKLGALSKGLLNDLCTSAFIEFRNGVSLPKRCEIE